MQQNTTKVNYQLELDNIIKNLEQENKVPTLLLHSCCGPCSSYVVTYLKNYFDLTVFFYNPNIFPREEYDHRLSEQTRLLKELNIPLLEIGYDHSEYLSYVKGLEEEPEGGARCSKCFELRLRKTYELAKERHFDYCCTTLTVSPHKNAMLINKIGQQLYEEFLPINNINNFNIMPLWLPSDFKKREGYKKSVELSKQYHLYRQDFCGCEFAYRGSEKAE